MIWRLISIVGIFLVTIFTTPLLSLPLSVWYSFHFFAPELIVLGAVLDSYFNIAGAWPYYTIGTALIVLGAELSKRHFMFK